MNRPKGSIDEMALLIVYDGAAAIQEQTLRGPFPLRISERERERDSRAFFNFLVLRGNMVRGESDKSS